MVDAFNVLDSDKVTSVSQRWGDYRYDYRDPSRGAASGAARRRSRRRREIQTPRGDPFRRQIRLLIDLRSGAAAGAAPFFVIPGEPWCDRCSACLVALWLAASTGAAGRTTARPPRAQRRRRQAGGGDGEIRRVGRRPRSPDRGVPDRLGRGRHRRVLPRTSLRSTGAPTSSSPTSVRPTTRRTLTLSNPSRRQVASTSPAATSGGSRRPCSELRWATRSKRPSCEAPWSAERRPERPARAV